MGMPEAMAGASGIGTVLGGIGAIQSGRQQYAAAKYEALQMQQAAGQTQAAGQHSAENVARESTLTQSHALAVAGASGGGVTDPTVLKAVSNLAGEGNRNFQAELFNANSQAAGMRAQAAATLLQGRQARSASYLNAASNILQGAGQTASMYYGSTKPQSMNQRLSGLRMAE